MKMTNDIDSLYDESLINTNNKGEYICPVCGKTAKKLSTITKHMELRDCHSYHQIFADTIVEQQARVNYNAYMDVNLSVAMFRKNKSYKIMCRIVLFCITHEVHNILQYMKFCSKQNEMLGYVEKVLTSEKTLKRYRLYLQKNPEMVDDDFFKRNIDNFLTDELFFVRSIEKSHITFEHAINNEKTATMLSLLPIGYAERLEEFYGEVYE